MPTTHHALQEFHPNHNPQPAKSRLVVLALLLATVAAVLTLPVLLPGGPGNRIVLAEVPRAPEAAASPTPWLCPLRNLKECLKDSEWPPAFEIPFVQWYYDRPRKEFGAWKDNLLRYQYLITPGIRTAYFRSQFSHCTNLPGVPLSFYGRPCEYFFPINPKTNRYDAYVYSTDRKAYFRLAANFGPPKPDSAIAYQTQLASCLCEPLTSANMPVGSPPGVAVDWFLTSGTSSDHSPEDQQGYYAAVAAAVPGLDCKEVDKGCIFYKPPYSFAGSVFGVHKPSNPNAPQVPGQIVYKWQSFKIVPSFDAAVFTPPTYPTKIPGKIWTKLPALNCQVCHLADTTEKTVFFTEIRKSKIKE
jgi:hypothetical protein